MKRQPKFAHLRTNSSIVGTSYQGHIDSNVVSLEKLVHVFGPPVKYAHDGKVTYTWALRVGDTIITIYDYKGDRWHIGGKTGAVVSIMQDIFQTIAGCGRDTVTGRI